MRLLCKLMKNICRVFFNNHTSTIAAANFPYTTGFFLGRECERLLSVSIFNMTQNGVPSINLLVRGLTFQPLLTSPLLTSINPKLLFRSICTPIINISHPVNFPYFILKQFLKWAHEQLKHYCALFVHARVAKTKFVDTTSPYCDPIVFKSEIP